MNNIKGNGKRKRSPSLMAPDLQQNKKQAIKGREEKQNDLAEQTSLVLPEDRTEDTKEEEIPSSPHFSLLQLDFTCTRHRGYFQLDIDALHPQNGFDEEKHAIQLNFQKMHTKEQFGHHLSKLTSASHICINTKKLDHNFTAAFKEYLKIHEEIRYVHIHAKTITEDYTYTFHNLNSVEDIFNTYSSVNEVEVDIDDYYAIDSVRSRIHDFIKRNENIRALIQRVKKELDALVSNEKLNEEARLIKLAFFYDEIWELSGGRFIDELFQRITKDSRQIQMLKDAREWHPLVASQNHSTSRLEEIFTFCPTLDVNKIYTSYQRKPTRLIDVTSDEKTIDYLVNQRKAAATSIDEDRKERGTPHNLLLRSCAGQLGAVGSYKVKIRSLCSFIDILHDAWAFTIAQGQSISFLKDEYVDVTLDFNQPLQVGAYKGYTLFQLICIYRPKLKIIDDVSPVLQQVKTLPVLQRKSILNSKFPNDNPNDHYFNMTVLHYLTYQLNLSFLFHILSEDMVFDESDLLVLTGTPSRDVGYLAGYHLLQLFIQRVVDETQRNLSRQDLKEYYVFLMKPAHKSKWGDLSVLSLRPQYTYDPREIPVFYYAARSQTDLAIVFSRDVLFDDFFSWERRNHKEYEGLTSFHASLLFGADKFCSELLKMLLNKRELDKSQIFSYLSERVHCTDTYRDYTFFQVAVSRGLSRFITTCREGSDLASLSNKPYPLTSPYPGLTPIQVAFYLYKRERYWEGNRIFLTLLKIKGIDLNVVYPSTIYLAGLNLLQAMVANPSDPGLPHHRNSGEFNPAFIEDFIKKVGDIHINYVCEERGSEFYGMTALRIAVHLQKTEFVKVLLKSPLTDYTKSDSHGYTPLQIANYLRQDDLQHALKEAQTKNPHHYQHYLTSKKSEVCPSLRISLDEWAIAIARENRSDHAFLIIEGLQQSTEEKSESITAVTWCAELYTPKGANTHLLAPILGKGRPWLQKEEAPLDLSTGKKTTLLPRLQQKMKVATLKSGAMLFYEQTRVKKATCFPLLKQIEKEVDEKKDFSYSLLGRRGFFGTSKRSQNCVDWARERYNQVVPPHRQLSPEWSDYVYTTARGFLNEHFVYLADSSTYHSIDSRFSLENRVSLLEKDKQRLISKQNALLHRQNLQWGLLAGVTTSCVIRDSLPYPWLWSTIAAGIGFFVARSPQCSPKEKGDHEVPQDEHSLLLK